jgi:hypothetical protein
MTKLTKKCCRFTLPLLILWCSACGIRPWHDHKNGVEATPDLTEAQCQVEAKTAAPVWIDSTQLATKVADLRTKKCTAQADLLAAKGGAFTQQTKIRADLEEQGRTTACLGDEHGAPREYFSGQLAGQQNTFNSCLDQAHGAPVLQTCVDAYRDSGRTAWSTAKAIGGCT